MHSIALFTFAAANNPETEPNFYTMPPVLLTSNVDKKKECNSSESSLKTIFDSPCRSASPGVCSYGNCLDTPIQTTRLFVPVVSPESTLVGSLLLPNNLLGTNKREMPKLDNVVRRHSLELSSEDLAFPDMIGDIDNTFDDAKDFIGDSPATFV